jgi:hypothetical protein
VAHSVLSDPPRYLEWTFPTANTSLPPSIPLATRGGEPWPLQAMPSTLPMRPVGDSRDSRGGTGEERNPLPVMLLKKKKPVQWVFYDISSVLFFSLPSLSCHTRTPAKGKAHALGTSFLSISLSFASSPPFQAVAVAMVVLIALLH